MLFTSKKGTTFTERIAVAISSLQRDTYAMSVLRGRLEAKLKTGCGPAHECGELQRMLDLVKVSETSLNELAGRVESARFLEDFIMIVSNAASSLAEVRDDIEKAVPVAEKALEEIQSAIVSCSGGSNVTDREKQDVMAEAADAAASQTRMIISPKENGPIDSSVADEEAEVQPLAA